MGQQSMKLIEIETDDVHLRLLTMIWLGLTLTTGMMEGLIHLILNFGGVTTSKFRMFTSNQQSCWKLRRSC